ncbi:MAG: hypothetical protein HYV09_26730 [Deltaproteobacteria bacterium]|nr:hypothetical protein [Deltaproteobacteria bacterium]
MREEPAERDTDAAMIAKDELGGGAVADHTWSAHRELVGAGESDCGCANERHERAAPDEPGGSARGTKHVEAHTLRARIRFGATDDSFGAALRTIPRNVARQAA